MNAFRLRWICAALFAFLPAAGYASTISFSNPTVISIPTSGAASPYPSQITVSGMGTVADLSVSLIAFSHTFPQDVAVMVVGPTGAGQVVFDGGTSNPILNADLTFADGGAPWPSSGVVGSGTYEPRAYFAGDTFPAPAPLIAGVNPTTLGVKSFSVFDGTNPNGLWSLYVVDLASGDAGAIAGGWKVTITDAAETAVPEPTSLLFLGTGLVGLAARRRQNRRKR